MKKIIAIIIFGYITMYLLWSTTFYIREAIEYSAAVVD